VTFGYAVMNGDGSGETNLTSDPTQDIDPAWSPNGSKIAFARYEIKTGLGCP
jgi:Tol biopolymer transport system component